MVKNISVDQAKARMENNPNVIILDVREDYEYNEGHVPHAILIPVRVLEEQIQIKDKNSEILVYCRSGQRAMNACNKLEKLGYTNVSNFGGIINWPYEIVKD